MHRLSIALSLLLTLHLLTTGLRWLFLAQLLPFGQVIATALIGVGVITLVYLTTLEASPLYYLYQEEAKVYALAGSVGVLLGLF